MAVILTDGVAPSISSISRRRRPLPAVYNFRRLLTWLRFLLLRILIALDLAAQLKLA